MYPAFLETKKLTKSATSSASPKRLAGTSLTKSFSSSELVMSVRMNPGATAFTVIFRLATS